MPAILDAELGDRLANPAFHLLTRQMGEQALGAVTQQRFGDVVGVAVIVCDADDQAALAIHQTHGAASLAKNGALGKLVSSAAVAQPSPVAPVVLTLLLCEKVIVDARTEQYSSMRSGTR